MDEPTEDVARLREAFASVSKSARPEAGCPEPDRLWAAAAGELTARSRRELVDHTSTCAACAEAWRLARELAPRSAVEEASEGWASRLGALLGLGGVGNRMALVGAAAAVLLGVAITTHLVGPLTRTVPPDYRDPNRAEIRSLLPEGEPLAHETALLRWSPGPPGSRYHVTVTTEDLRLIVTASEVEAAQLQIPAELLSALPAGTKLFWQVEVRLPDGGRVRSDTFFVRLQ